ncbi:hypothetical protein PIB30_058854 [Stylosanthes scabra]|uniref:Uncharacterized protein n=1 Tax=Stylosanthes scabra TaxID=79078 RepID=A0ABU6ZIS2_9FABA|nr:hypothetical protein [Stylosanthes scabra]
MDILLLLQLPLEMESDGSSSASRRSVGGVRGEQSFSVIQGFFAAKIRLNHSKFFLWLDQHAAKFGRVANTKGVKEEEDNVDEHF